MLRSTLRQILQHRHRSSTATTHFRRNFSKSTKSTLKSNNVKKKPKSTSQSSSTSNNAEQAPIFEFLEWPAVQIGLGVLQFSSILYCVQTYVLDITMCVGPSMLPTFHSAGKYSKRRCEQMQLVIIVRTVFNQLIPLSMFSLKSQLFNKPKQCH